MTGAARPRKVVPFHPVLVAAFPVLSLYAHNLGQAPIEELVRPVLVATGGACALWGLAAALFRSAGRGAAAASAVTLALLSYGHVLNVAPQGARALVMPALAAAVLAAVWAAWRARGPLPGLTGALNLASLALVAPALFTIAAGQGRHAAPTHPEGPGGGVAAVTSGHDRARELLQVRPLTAEQRRDLPDVYLIILDAYGRADILKLFFGYDNAPFIREMERRGFYVAARSTANYNQTGLCLASELNMGYLDGLASAMGPRDRNPEPLRKWVDDSAVVAHLRGLGYRFVGVGTDGPTRLEKADLVLRPRAAVSTLEGGLMGLTALQKARRSRMHMAAQLRERIRFTFDAIPRVARLPYRKFVLVHVMAPHPPFVLGPNGEEVETNDRFTYDDGTDLLRYITADQYARGYVGQLRYVNRRTIEAIDAIRRSSRRPPIIIVQGDHGSRMSMDWMSAANSDLRGPFCILNAYRVPAAARAKLYPRISPVNTFRVLMPAVFGADCDLLPDRSFFSTSMEPFALTDVTEAVRTASGPPRIPHQPLIPNMDAPPNALDAR